jgi:transcriptional regulator with XRE-family HTH domain
MKCPVCKGTGLIDAHTASLGTIIAARRQEIGMLQQELADKVGMSRTSIANVETGRQQIVLTKIRPFAEALGMKLEDFVP